MEDHEVVAIGANFSSPHPNTVLGHDTLRQLMTTPLVWLSSSFNERFMATRFDWRPQNNPPLAFGSERLYVSSLLPMLKIELWAELVQEYNQNLANSKSFPLLPFRWTKLARSTLTEKSYEYLLVECAFNSTDPHINSDDLYSEWVSRMVVLFAEEPGSPKPLYSLALPAANDASIIIGYIESIRLDQELVENRLVPTWRNQDGSRVGVHQEVYMYKARIWLMPEEGACFMNLLDPQDFRLFMIPASRISTVNRQIRMMSLPQCIAVSPVYEMIRNPTTIRNRELNLTANETPQEYFSRAFTQIIRSGSQRNALILQGFPSTGKTSILVDTLSRNLTPNTRVLVCTSSNEAANVFAEKMITAQANRREAHNNDVVQLHVMRYGHKLSPMCTEDIQRQMSEFDGLLEEDGSPMTNASKKRALYRRANVTIGTLGSCQIAPQATNAELRESFDWLVVDECGQASEGELLLPMAYPNIRNVIFAGDKAQLGATFYTKKMQNTDPISTSVLIRLSEFLNIRHQPRGYLIKLNVQHRLKQQLKDVVVMLSYPEETIHNGPGVAQLMPGLAAFRIYSSGAWYEHRGKSHSFSNEKEACFLLRVLQSLVDDRQRRRVQPANLTICIISFYSNQVSLIRRLVGQNAGLRNRVIILTVDSSQGHEYDIVFVSGVRGNAPHNQPTIGFAREIRRLNVAISRGHCCYFFANSTTFSIDAIFQRLFDFAAIRGCVYPNADSMSLNDIRNSLRE